MCQGHAQEGKMLISHYRPVLSVAVFNTPGNCNTLPLLSAHSCSELLGLGYIWCQSSLCCCLEMVSGGQEERHCISELLGLNCAHRLLFAALDALSK